MNRRNPSRYGRFALGTLRVGTSGYAYKEWRGSFYPEKLADKKMLEFYSRHFTTVEINYTFYRLPSASTLETWIPQTPDNFLFALKGNQRITHILRLRQTEKLVEAFLAGAVPLAAAGRLGPILLQLPPNFRADIALLKDFLASLPSRAVLRWTMEFRHPSWFVDETLDLLRSHGVALCVAETDEACTPDTPTAPFGYYRLRRTDYSPAQIAAWKTRFDQLLEEGRDLYVYFKHEDKGTAPRFADQLLAR